MNKSLKSIAAACALAMMVCAPASAKVFGHEIKESTILENGKKMRKAPKIKLVNVNTDEMVITIYDANFDPLYERNFTKILIASETSSGQTAIYKDTTFLRMTRHIDYTAKGNTCTIEFHPDEAHTITMTGLPFVVKD